MLIQNVALGCKFTMEILLKTDADIQNFPFFFFTVDLYFQFNTNKHSLCWYLFLESGLEVIKLFCAQLN